MRLTLHALQSIERRLRSRVHGFDRLHSVLTTWTHRNRAEHIAVAAIWVSLVIAHIALIVEIRESAFAWLGHSAPPIPCAASIALAITLR